MRECVSHLHKLAPPDLAGKSVPGVLRRGGWAAPYRTAGRGLCPAPAGQDARRSSNHKVRPRWSPMIPQARDSSLTMSSPCPRCSSPAGRAHRWAGPGHPSARRCTRARHGPGRRARSARRAGRRTGSGSGPACPDSPARPGTASPASARAGAAGPLVRPQAEPAGQPGRDDTGPQHVLHRHAQAQVDRQRQGGEQLNTPGPGQAVKPRRGLARDGCASLHSGAVPGR